MKQTQIQIKAKEKETSSKASQASSLRSRRQSLKSDIAENGGAIAQDESKPKQKKGKGAAFGIVSRQALFKLSRRLPMRPGSQFTGHHACPCHRWSFSRTYWRRSGCWNVSVPSDTTNKPELLMYVKGPEINVSELRDESSVFALQPIA